MPPFKVVSDFSPSGDQPTAIRAIAERVLAGERFTTLLGATGTGKTATAAWALDQIQKPTLVIAPNKSLAAQLCNEFKQFFPNNAVEYFVSYYDYYQPEAYVPSSDTYIEKDSSINDEIERLRHSATSALLQRDDVLIVASVSCIFGLGSPEEYLNQVVTVARGGTADRDFITQKLVDIQYERNDVNFVRGKFRVRGDTIEIFPAYEERALRVELFGDQVDRIIELDPLTGEVTRELDHVTVYPASHYVASRERMERAIIQIESELSDRLQYFDSKGKLLEAQRLRMRTEYDLEMMREVGFCSGIENYARHIEGREPGTKPNTLLDYFRGAEGNGDFLVVIDESHVTVPQLNGMYEGDMSRKRTLVEHGFRLPSALDNRPLRFDEFLEAVDQVVFMSATPSAFELRNSGTPVEQLVRPTGLVDPEVLIRPTKGQIDDLMEEIKGRTEVEQRVLVTTLTKKMAEDLTDYLLESGVRVRYLHSDINTVERIEILRDLRLGEFDVLVGINLLREGIDLPEVSLVAILDADKEGYLRSQTSLIQTIGRAARNVDGQVIMYADEVTDSMRRAISETQRRRQIQLAYNEEHNIDPQSIRKAVSDILISGFGRKHDPTVPTKSRSRRKDPVGGTPDELRRLLLQLEEEMHQAAEDLRFEYAARIRDEIVDLKRELREVG
ncbi:MAG: excinuclease subunit [Actinomycetota bacterium]|jgi:excinuclease ABC subunit B|nr:excinuclease subunit [Actinomycetota bacterium]